MSLLEALAEAVVNVSAAKSGGGLTRNTDAGLDSLFGNKPQQSGGGIEDVLGAILGGQQQQTGAPQGGLGGLGGLLEALTQGAAGGSSTQSSGGLEDLLGQLTSAAGGKSGGLGGILGAIAGAATSQSGGASSNSPGFGELLNQSIANRGKGVAIPKPSAPQEAAAGLMLRAMIQAAKSDGQFDQSEQQKLLGKLGEVSAAEQRFVQEELTKPVDVTALARDVPRGLEQQVYAMSVLGIDLDNQNEAQYLDQLAQAFGLDQNTVNAVHAKLGAPALYR